jgi:hypothetical protein
MPLILVKEFCNDRSPQHRQRRFVIFFTGGAGVCDLAEAAAAPTYRTVTA